MRPTQRTDDPQAFPYSCIICGLGKGPSREFFIDLGFDIAGQYRPIQEGAVYLCNECAPNVINSCLEIFNDHANRVMDNNLLKEEASYELIGQLTGRSELSAVSARESSRPVLDRLSDRGTIQGVDSAENLPDPGHSTGSEENRGLVNLTDLPAATVDEQQVVAPPTFIMGKPVRNNRAGQRVDPATGELLD